MAKIEKFRETDFPYGILAQFWMTEEIIEDFPPTIMNNILLCKHTSIFAHKTKGKRYQSF